MPRHFGVILTHLSSISLRYFCLVNTSCVRINTKEIKFNLPPLNYFSQNISPGLDWGFYPYDDYHKGRMIKMMKL